MESWPFEPVLNPIIAQLYKRENPSKIYINVM